jgi:hypothetical protein
MIVTIITMVVINVECDFSTAGALYVIICSRFNCIEKVEFCLFVFSYYCIDLSQWTLPS